MRFQALCSQVPDIIRPFLRKKDARVLASIPIPVRHLFWPEPKVLQVTSVDTIQHPDHVSAEPFLVSAGRRLVDAQGNVPTGFGLPDPSARYHVDMFMIVEDSVVFLSNGLLWYHGFCKLAGFARSMCRTPTGFVVCTDRYDSPHAGLLVYMESKMLQVHTPHAWRAMTWGHQLAATQWTPNEAVVSLLTRNGQVSQVLRGQLRPRAGRLHQMGFSILYDPKWDEYLVSGSRHIVALSATIPPSRISYRGMRVVYEHGQDFHAYHLRGLTWCPNTVVPRTLLCCNRGEHVILYIQYI